MWKHFLYCDTDLHRGRREPRLPELSRHRGDGSVLWADNQHSSSWYNTPTRLRGVCVRATFRDIVWSSGRTSPPRSRDWLSFGLFIATEAGCNLVFWGLELRMVLFSDPSFLTLTLAHWAQLSGFCGLRLNHHTSLWFCAAPLFIEKGVNLSSNCKTRDDTDTHTY